MESTEIGSQLGGATHTRVLTRRRFGLIAAVAVVGAIGTALPADAAKVRSLAKPSPIVVSAVTANGFSLSIGGSTTKTYHVFVNGAIQKFATPSNATLPIAITNLASNTSYSVTVQEFVASSYLTSPLSNPISVRTAVSAVARPVTNLRLVSAVPQAITVTWDRQPVTDVNYDIYLNGILVTSTAINQVEIRGKYGYPNILPGTEPKPGANVVGVVTRSTAAASLGETSATVEITVNVPSS